jgi:hypothetical protein
MTHDLIVDEVRALRDELAREHDYDIDAIFTALRQLEADSGRQHVSLSARRVSEPTGSSAPARAAQRGAAADDRPQAGDRA